MWSLYHDPQGKNIFRDIETTAEGKCETLSVRHSISTEREQEKEVEDRNRELEQLNTKLVQRNRELEDRCKTLESTLPTNVVRYCIVFIGYDE